VLGGGIPQVFLQRNSLDWPWGFLVACEYE
jgi:hypothetical protein